MKFEEERPDRVVNQLILLKSECRILGIKNSLGRFTTSKLIPDDGLDSDTIVIYSIRVSYIPRIMLQTVGNGRTLKAFTYRPNRHCFQLNPPTQLSL